jgi:hypothetical protein
VTAKSSRFSGPASDVDHHRRFVDSQGRPTQRMMSSIPLDFEKLEEYCAILEKVAKSYPRESPEHAAVFAAAWALNYVQRERSKEGFRTWIETLTRPLTALEILHSKLAGVDDLPHELLDESMREVEQLMEKLRHKRT